MLKERKDPKDVRSYRPVALTNVLCKIFERMTNKRLVWYPEKEKKVDDRQYGFRKQRSAISKILGGFKRKEKTAAFFVDIEKAYDKVNTDKVLEQENVGIQGRMLKFIRELIIERWIKMRVGGSISQSKRTDLEILQGGVLGENIFLMAIKGILGKMGNGVDRSLFADYLAIYITTRRQSPAGSDQQARCMGSGERLDIFLQQNSKYDI